MSQKLDSITPSYHAFVPDQILSDKDLNEVINYFEDQRRLSRICLSGVGIVCGFKLTTKPNGDFVFVNLSQGAGVTTDGDLLHLLQKESDGTSSLASTLQFTKYKSFINSEIGRV
jgi:hypothetical protein